MTPLCFPVTIGVGNIVLYQTVNGEKIVVVENFGTVNYSLGVVRLNAATLRAFTGSINVFAEISGNRVVSSERFILLQDFNDAQRALITTFADDRPDRQIIASAGGSEFVGTSSISVNLASVNTTRSTSSSSGQSSSSDQSSTPSTPSGGGGY